VSEFAVDKVFGKDRLEGATLAIAYDKGNLSIKGDGKMGGSQASIDVQQTRQGGEANVAFSLDEAARSKRGLSFGSQLTGAVPLKATMPLGKSAKPGIRIEADLTKAGVDQLIPGWVKPAGRPGKLSFTLVEGSGDEIRDLLLDSGPVQLRGTAMLSSDGGLEKAELTTFKLSPGDDMRAQIERSNGAYKVTVRGNVGDLRPFAKAASSSPATGARNAAAQRESRDMDLDLALNILTGYNDEAITNASVKASMRKDNIRQLDLKGRLGATNIVARTVTLGNSNPVITLQSEDAGSLLRFVDVYRRMTGGSLVLQLATGDGPQAGLLTLHSFALNNEPALRRIIPTQTQVVAGQDRAGNPQAVRVDVNEITFTKARIDFTRTAGRLDFKDAAIFGTQVGFTLGGYIDYARDRMDISGTFVPAYGLNNAFAQVPLFGPLLGGGQYEGLFAVNFRVSGQTDAPTLSVNPLSAVAPGFLRRLFGVGGEPQTGSLPTVPER
jgi:AsmA-like C-terminal region